jgi:hypothetical protein
MQTTHARFHFIVMPRFFRRLLLLGVALCAIAARADLLEASFQNPPESAKPHTWWHWMNGNVTKEGITADLEAMKRVGIGGAQIFNVDSGIPHGPVQFLSPEWRELMKHAAKEADRLGIELCLHNCAGWSSSGGPWNTPEHAMQHVVTSEVQVKGPMHFSGALPQPPTRNDFYRDIVVFAFRTPDGEGVDFKSLAPKVTASVDGIDGAKLIDGKATTSVTLPAPETGKPQFFQLEFSQLFAARTIVLTPGTNTGECKGVIQVSDDGKDFRDARAFTFMRRPTRPLGISLANESVSARFYRVLFTAAAKGAKEFSLGDIDLSPQLRIESVESKDGDTGGFIMSSQTGVEVAPSLVVKRNEMIDLTSKLGADGHLDWDAPAGDWTILRLGYTPTGRSNHPAPAEATGLECDKFSKAALNAHWAGFMQKVLDDLGPLAGKTGSLNNALIDSYEVGGQNWSPRFREEFQKRRGYDPLPFLPTFTGRVVDNPEISERFLWDLRRTIADLFAENYYGHFQELCHQHGLKASIEPYTGPFESLQCGAPADIPMGEFWVGQKPHSSLKLASTVGHIYGKPVIGAESFTASPGAHGRWQEDPYSIKALGDLVFCQGINRYIFHRYAMQPWTNRWPGMTMGQWGTHFDRTSTWWEQGREWLRYVARCQSLLQQGHFVADAAYFCGESTPAEMRVDQGEFSLPDGYDYDGINADVLLHHAKVKNGRLVLESGMSYRVLILPPSDRNMTPTLLRKLRDFVADGLTLVGYSPEASPSLQNYPKCDDEVQKLVTEMWGDRTNPNITEHKLGKGKVVWQKLSNVLAGLNAKPDFEFATAAGSQLAFIHREIGGADIYFVSNQRGRFDSVDCTFRISGKAPELWHADTGVMERAPIWREENGRTIVPIQFDPAGSVFVVFRKAAKDAHVLAANGSFREATTDVGPKVEIRRATYSAIDGADSMDVTELVRRRVNSGEFTVVASNGELGRDPAVNHPKQLHLDFVVDEKPATMVVAENESFTFPGAANTGSAPVWQPVASGNGKTSVRAWADGRAEFRVRDGRILKAEAKNIPAPIEVSGAWDLTFPPNWGAPEMVKLDKLISWSDSADAGVKYFSGTATYAKEIEILAGLLGANRELWLDLGKVKNFAEVSLNGKPLGILWKPPFRVNVTGAARSGRNKLEIKVTNLWPNRLIGDEQLPDDREWNGKQLKGWPQWVLDGKPSPTGRLTFTTWHHWTKNEPLLESGLLGPVTLRVAERVIAE